MEGWGRRMALRGLGIRHCWRLPGRSKKRSILRPRVSSGRRPRTGQSFHAPVVGSAAGVQVVGVQPRSPEMTLSLGQAMCRHTEELSSAREHLLAEKQEALCSTLDTHRLPVIEQRTTALQAETTRALSVRSGAWGEDKLRDRLRALILQEIVAKTRGFPSGDFA